MSRYDDIINLPHHVSKNRPPMSMHDRAAQFSPFAALTGYEAVVAEVGRRTTERQEIDEQLKIKLNQRLLFLRDHLSFKPQVDIKYFVPDHVKTGGEYRTIVGRVDKFVMDTRSIIMTSGEVIGIDDITNLTGKLFDDLDE